MMIRNGNSPLTVTGLDPGIMYSVIINVFDGNQVVLSNSRVMENVTVIINNGGGEFLVLYTVYICTYIYI